MLQALEWRPLSCWWWDTRTLKELLFPSWSWLLVSAGSRFQVKDMTQISVSPQDTQDVREAELASCLQHSNLYISTGLPGVLQPTVVAAAFSNLAPHHHL